MQVGRLDLKFAGRSLGESDRLSRPDYMICVCLIMLSVSVPD